MKKLYVCQIGDGKGHIKCSRCDGTGYVISTKIVEGEKR